jgi:hypothetical protein
MTTYDDEYVEDAPQVYDGPPIPVHITSGSHTDYTERLAPDFGSAGTFVLQLAGAAQPVQVLQRRYRRNKARVLVMSMSGTVTELTPGNPAPGSTFTYTNTSGQAQTLNSVTWRLVTDATVANRFMSIQIKDASGNVIATALQTGTGTPASTTITWFASANTGAATFAGASGNQASGLPSVILQPGYSVTLAVSNMDAGDQISNIIFTFTQNNTAIFHNRPDVLSLPTPPPNVGIQVSSAPYSFDWESQQPLYGVGIGGLVTVSVIDETYADVTT